MSRGNPRIAPPTPRTLFISVTSECNHDCGFCADGLHGEIERLDRATVRRILDECRAMGIVTVALAGGEPLLHPEILGIVEDAGGVVLLLFTNGDPLTDATAREFASRRNLTTMLNLSSGGGVYRAMDLLRRHGAGWGVSRVATRSDLPSILAAERDYVRWNEMGCSLAAVIEYLPSGKKIRKEEILRPPDRAALRAMARRLGREGVTLHLLPSEEEGDGLCQAGGRGLFHINARGGIEPCPFIHVSRDNVRTTPLAKALDSDLFRRLRGRARRRSDDVPCPFLLGGGAEAGRLHRP